MKILFSSESVTQGHPDKVADAIADQILDEILTKDPEARVACEVAINKNLVFIFGEITTTAVVDYEKIARDKIVEIGYDHDELEFNGHTVKVLVDINRQSPDIALGVDASDQKEQGAGDQGLMFGYATNQTDSYMPLPIELAHKLAKRLTEVRKKEIVNGLRPDGKTQVTVEYDRNNHVKRIDTIVISTQHHPNINYGYLKKALKDFVIDEIVDASYLDEDTKILINPTGQFVIGGPAGDSGLTGRKIIVDTYGGYARHGGGAFSGKDPSKVDRSAAYMARHIAKNIVASKVADTCEIQIAYAIGVAKPVSVLINTFGTEKVAIEKIEALVAKEFDLRPASIISYLKLKAPIYAGVSSYGHFGQDEVLSWELKNKVALFKGLL